MSAVLRHGERAQQLSRVKIPFLAYVMGASPAFPLVAAAGARRPVHGARAWIVAWCVALMAIQNLALYFALNHQNNLWVSPVTTPVTTVLILWALSCMQVSDTGRLAVRLALAGALVLYAVLMLLFESTSTFSRAAEPTIYLLCLVVAAATLVLRSHGTRESLLGQGWFWLCAGIALYFASWSALGPLSALLVDRSPELLSLAYQVHSVIEVCAMAAIAWGMTCPAET